MTGILHLWPVAGSRYLIVYGRSETQWLKETNFSLQPKKGACQPRVSRDFTLASHVARAHLLSHTQSHQTKITLFNAASTNPAKDIVGCKISNQTNLQKLRGSLPLAEKDYSNQNFTKSLVLEIPEGEMVERQTDPNTDRHYNRY